MQKLTMAFTVAAVIALLTPLSAQAGIACGERDKFIDYLGAHYKEQPKSLGLTSSGDVIELLTSDGGTWTIMVTKPSGKSCIVAAGESWEDVLPKLIAKKGPKA